MYRHNTFRYIFKRTFDIILSLSGLTISLPLWLIIILAILMQDGRPIFFCDTRVGKGGKIFKTIKFRSMIKDAEKIAGSIYASKSDKRVTAIGRILRSTALDELPQLINIFKGEMSFVGPRPEKENYAEVFRKVFTDYDLRHAAAPGLTGPAQVYLKYDSSPKEKLKYDLLYVREGNFLWDIRLIVKSFFITLKAGWGKFEENRSPANISCITH